MAIAKGSGHLPQSLFAGLKNLLALVPNRPQKREQRQPDHLWMEKTLNAPVTNDVKSNFGRPLPLMLHGSEKAAIAAGCIAKSQGAQRHTALKTV